LRGNLKSRAVVSRDFFGETRWNYLPKRCFLYVKGIGGRGNIFRRRETPNGRW